MLLARIVSTIARACLPAHVRGRIAATLALLATSGLAVAGPVTISGHVTRHMTGEALGNVRLSIWYQQTPFTSLEIGTPTTAADGSYVWNGICPDSTLHPCHVAVYDERYLYQDREVRGGSTFTADFVLVEPATISGALKIDGVPTSKHVDISVSYWLESQQRWASPQFTYEQNSGRYVIGRLPPGVPYKLCAGNQTYGENVGSIEQCFDHHDRSSPRTDPAYDLITLGEGERRDDVNFEMKSGGSISGTLYDAYRGKPLPKTSIWITLFDETGSEFMVASSVSDENGRYRVQGLHDGTFYVVAFIGENELLDRSQIYPHVICAEDTCEPLTRGQRLSISGGTPLTSIDFTVRPNVVIRGRVTDASTGRALAGVPIRESWEYFPSATTDADGEYIFYTSDNTWPFKIYATEFQPYIDQIYPDISCAYIPLCEGQLFAPARGSVIEHVDFALQTGAAVTGTVRDAATGLPTGGTIFMYDEHFNLVWTGDINPNDGSYLSNAWQPGTYYVKAKGYYACAFYDNRPCPPNELNPALVSPTPITIGIGEIRHNVDFHLDAETIFRSGFDP